MNSPKLLHAYFMHHLKKKNAVTSNWISANATHFSRVLQPKQLNDICDYPFSVLPLLLKTAKQIYCECEVLAQTSYRVANLVKQKK
jgi:hypothetical protein